MLKNNNHKRKQHEPCRIDCIYQYEYAINDKSTIKCFNIGQENETYTFYNADTFYDLSKFEVENEIRTIK